MDAFASLLAFVACASAHGGVLYYANGGNWYDGWQPYNTPTGQTSIQRPWSSYNPIQDATDPTIGCNDDGTAGALQLTATVAAGSDITAYWNQWPHPTGPVMTYLADCGGDCTSVNSNTAKWFKIQEAGLINGTVASGTWAAGVMAAGNSSWTTTIPATVPSGNYLIRFETIALHSMPAQFYPECAQIEITGGGSLQPTAAELVSLPGAYSNTDPGVNINLYSEEATTETCYQIPGPPLYGSDDKVATCGSTTTTPPPPSSTSSSGTAPTSTGSSGSSGGGSIPQFGQCGGTGWTGSGSCASPYTCQVQNTYYSQCL
ncbi:hypothetical protein CONPUDRAFT_139222 [Coniophora puteana RWD-64-598 SS2]|uniref:AA9 family lytic polysaccharide monooxygenase n=1 Tax=Coniophora puteana (strain RWD-64-598) TaxID=741705 RepID=A0A5M3MEK2_CONPW|nr:uncharacterized protein CONPUDRAFT_139222 [Coniophora puteana RWD-64-598 SS2]EIW77477.1 hypothetical protein CONPUDRAFT_139222 [Coniophora puteana RWD-64-598 SS2]